MALAQDIADLKTKGFGRALFAEFVGCFFLCFIGCGCVAAGVGQVVAFQPINGATGSGFVVTVLIMALGDVSGGHFNPAITVMLAVCKKFPLIHVPVYIIVQLLGCIAGGGVLRVCVGEGHYQTGIGLNAFMVDNKGSALFMEFLGTLLLLLVILGVAVRHYSNRVQASLAAIPVGFTVLAVVIVLGPFTGAGINPARTIGTVIWENDMRKEHIQHIYIYIVGPFLASFVAPLMAIGLYGWDSFVPIQLDDGTVVRNNSVNGSVEFTNEICTQSSDRTIKSKSSDRTIMPSSGNEKEGKTMTEC